MPERKNLLKPERDAAMVASGCMMPEGECAFCDRFRFEWGDVAGPSHTPSRNCRSGGRPHCTCDTCY